jgi:hypothetical protein
MSRGVRRCSVFPLIPAVFLLLQAVISVHTELVAVPVYFVASDKDKQ